VTGPKSGSFNVLLLKASVSPQKRIAGNDRFRAWLARPPAVRTVGGV
jgi:hypothetical protein